MAKSRPAAAAAAQSALEAHVAELRQARDDLALRLKQAETNREDWRRAADKSERKYAAADHERARLAGLLREARDDANWAAVNAAGKIAALENALSDARATVAGLARQLGKLSADELQRANQDEGDYAKTCVAREQRDRDGKARPCEAPRPTSDPVGFAAPEG